MPCNLQSLAQSQVQLGNLGHNRQVDGLVTNVNNQAAQNVWVHLVGDLQGLVTADKARLLDGSLQSLQDLGVQRLGRGDGGLNNTSVGVKQQAKVLVDGRELAQSVVLRQNRQKVGDGLVQLQAGRKSVNHSLSVVLGQRWVGQELVDLGVLLDQLSHFAQTLVGSFNRRLLDRGRVQSIGIGTVHAKQLHRRLNGLGGRGHRTGEKTGGHHLLVMERKTKGGLGFSVFRARTWVRVMIGWEVVRGRTLAPEDALGTRGGLKRRLSGLSEDWIAVGNLRCVNLCGLLEGRLNNEERKEMCWHVTTHK